MSTATYTIRIAGRLDSTTLAAFPEFRSDLVDGDTLLAGPIVDRSALHGVLSRLRSLDLDLVDLRKDDRPR
jgi:hypothetical protein